MANLTQKKRACVLIVDQDLKFGIKLADWLAAHGYQAVLIRSVATAVDEYQALQPHAVLIGLDYSKTTVSINLLRLFRAIESACSRVPVITMGDRTSSNLTIIPSGGVIRHLHLPIKLVEFSYIGRLLRSELVVASASPSLPNTGSASADGWMQEHRSHLHHISSKAAR